MVDSWKNSTGEQYFILGGKFCIAPDSNGRLGSDIVDDVKNISFTDNTYQSKPGLFDLIYNPSGDILTNSSNNYRVLIPGADHNTIVIGFKKNDVVVQSHTSELTNNSSFTKISYSLNDNIITWIGKDSNNVQLTNSWTIVNDTDGSNYILLESTITNNSDSVIYGPRLQFFFDLDNLTTDTLSFKTIQSISNNTLKIRGLDEVMELFLSSPDSSFIPTAETGYSWRRYSNTQLFSSQEGGSNDNWYPPDRNEGFTVTGDKTAGGFWRTNINESVPIGESKTFTMFIYNTFKIVIESSDDDVFNYSNIEKSYVNLKFTSTVRSISDFRVEHVKVSGGELVNFSGSEKEYTATLIIFEREKPCIVDIPAGSFGRNEASQFVVTREALPGPKQKKDKEKAKLITKILKMTEPDTNSFLTQFRAYMANNTFSVSEKENFQDFLLKNGQYSRAILFKIFDLLDGHSVLNSQVSMRHEIVDYNDFKNMNQLLEVSLGDDIMNKYLVNREPDVFHNISRLISYLHTDFYHIMEDYTLVFSGGQASIEQELSLTPPQIELSEGIDSELITLISLLLEDTDNKLIEISSTSTDTVYGSMNTGMKAIVDIINQLSQDEEAMSDLKTLINGESNGINSSLGSMKLTLIKKTLFPPLQEFYFKDSFYGIPVGIYNPIISSSIMIIKPEIYDSNTSDPITNDFELTNKDDIFLKTSADPNYRQLFVDNTRKAIGSSETWNDRDSNTNGISCKLKHSFKITSSNKNYITIYAIGGIGPQTWNTNNSAEGIFSIDQVFDFSQVDTTATVGGIRDILIVDEDSKIMWSLIKYRQSDASSNYFNVSETDLPDLSQYARITLTGNANSLDKNLYLYLVDTSRRSWAWNALEYVEVGFVNE